MKLIDVLASIFVAFGWHTVDWMTGVDDALNKGHLNDGDEGGVSRSWSPV